MKALRLEGKRKLTLCDAPEPIKSDFCEVISVEIAGIGGSEYLGFDNPGIRTLPSIIGHGFAGVTTSGARAAVYPLTGCGQCHFCTEGAVQLCDGWSLIGVQKNGGFTQKVSVPTKQLFELPDDVSWEQSVFIEPFANSVNAWEVSSASDDSSVAIIGAGSLGLGLVAKAHQSNCKLIHISDMSRTRLLAAKELGATELYDELHQKYDVVFDTVGSKIAKNQAIASTKKGGKCIFLGFEEPHFNLNISEIIRHQKQLIGSFVYSERQFKEAITLVTACKSHWVKSLAFHEVEAVLIKFCQGDFDIVKAALRPNK